MAIKSFAFRSTVINRYLSNGPHEDVHTWCPRFILPVLSELAEQVRGMNFYPEPEDDGGIRISMFDRSQSDICQLVDWTVTIWNTSVRPELRSRKMTAAELVDNARLRDGWASRESVLLMLEHWGEFEEISFDEYVDIERYPLPADVDEPYATAGNLCAAFGLAVLDNAINLHSNKEFETLLMTFSAAWEFASVARSLNREAMGRVFEQKAQSSRMSKAAANRYKRDPKQAVKLEVRSCWEAWEKSSSSYPSVAAFARDMLSKWPELLTSEAVIARWVRDWREASTIK